MSQYVLMLSVGPVQGFIAAARRSRDLWSGSWLLSEMSKAGAKYLYAHQAQMVFPHIDATNAQLLEPGSDFSVGNKIQVLLETEDANAVRELAAQAAQAVRQRFLEVAEEAKKELGQAALRTEIWDLQVDDYVEVQSAWAKVADAKSYKQACDRVASVLAARKATRDFKASAILAEMLPKSSLDGARETVLHEGKLSRLARLQLGLNDSEQLDCAGVVKRLGGKQQSEQFTPIPRVAADAWLQTLSDENLALLREAYQPLVALDLATRVRGNKECYQAFPYDAQFVYPFRLEAALGKNDIKTDTEAATALANLQKVLKPLWKQYGEPCSYGVLLLADGDKMGELLDRADNAEKHKRITKDLSAFAGDVAGIMRTFRGHTVYAGGDDVLGFVPLSQALQCAEALAVSFESKLSGIAKELNATAPTLSVGLAIAHINTPLGHVRLLAGQAEKVAKGDAVKDPSKQRNALGITLAVRSGSTSDMRLRWDDQQGLQAFKQWIDQYQQKTITSRVAYDTRDVHLRTHFPHSTEATDYREAIRVAEFKLMLSKARTLDGSKLPDELVRNLQERFQALGDLNDLATELIVARWMAAKTQKDLGKI